MQLCKLVAQKSFLQHFIDFFATLKMPLKILCEDKNRRKYFQSCDIV